jgi:hypothetical protein
MLIYFIPNMCVIIYFHFHFRHEEYSIASVHKNIWFLQYLKLLRFWIKYTITPVLRGHLSYNFMNRGYWIFFMSKVKVKVEWFPCKAFVTENEWHTILSQVLHTLKTYDASIFLFNNILQSMLCSLSIIFNITNFVFFHHFLCWTFMSIEFYPWFFKLLV